MKSRPHKRITFTPSQKHDVSTLITKIRYRRGVYDLWYDEGVVVVRPLGPRHTKQLVDWLQSELGSDVKLTIVDEPSS